MDIAAAPFREIWFSTVNGFTSAHAGPHGPGDLLSASGRVVAPKGQMIENLGIMPVVPHLAIDAIEIAPGGEMLFWLNESISARASANSSMGMFFPSGAALPIASRTWWQRLVTPCRNLITGLTLLP
jgi:hypothetical protein